MPVASEINNVIAANARKSFSTKMARPKTPINKARSFRPRRSPAAKSSGDSGGAGRRVLAQQAMEIFWAVRKIIVLILVDGIIQIFEFIRRECDETCRQVLLIAGCSEWKMRVLGIGAKAVLRYGAKGDAGPQ